MWVKPVFSGWDKSGTLISKFEENNRDVDIKNITVSHCDQTKCKRTPSDAEVQIDTSHWRRAYWDTVIGFWVRDVANLC